MFSQDDEQGRHDHHDGTDIKFRLIERRQGKPRYFLNVGQVDAPHEEGQDITGNDPDKDRDDADEAAAEDGRQNGDDEGKGRNDHSRFIGHALDFPHIARHVHGQRRQFQTDDGYDRSHGSRREQDIDPLRPHLVDDSRQDDKGQAEDDEPPLGVAIGHARRSRNRQNR